MRKILIEFYSGRAPENLISLLHDRFDEIVFLYFQTKEPPTAQIQEQLSGVVRELFGFDAQFIPVSSPQIGCVLETLSGVTEEGNTYVLDITGGDEIFIAAAGIYSQKAKGCTVLLRHYDVKSGVKTEDFPKDEGQATVFPKYLKATHLLCLNGTPPLSAPSYTFSYGPLRHEVLRLWKAVRWNAKDWNRFCSLSAGEEGSESSPFRKTFHLSGEDCRCYQAISEKLKKAGILTDERETRKGTKVTATFHLSVAKEALFLYEKAGNLLEMYTALAFYDTGLFSDIRVGVIVDWNGVFATPQTPDPRNEIDLILMKENLPILASCKNTIPKNDYLYEIATMASHYGGYFATGMLLSSYRASPTVRERAKEMGLVLIDDIRRIPYEKLVSVLKKTFSEEKKR